MFRIKVSKMLLLILEEFSGIFIRKTPKDEIRKVPQQDRLYSEQLNCAELEFCDFLGSFCYPSQQKPLERHHVKLGRRRFRGSCSCNSFKRQVGRRRRRRG